MRTEISRTEISAKVRVSYGVAIEVIVRKVEYDDNGDVFAIYGLLKNGEWQRKKEGEPYPDACSLPVNVTIRTLDDQDF